jgi:hypothetical protein
VLRYSKRQKGIGGRNDDQFNVCGLTLWVWTFLLTYVLLIRFAFFGYDDNRFREDKRRIDVGSGE